MADYVELSELGDMLARTSEPFEQRRVQSGANKRMSARLSRVFVEVNGLRVPEVGDGTTADAACFFSRDGGVSPLPLTSVAQGDVLYWQGSVAGFELTPSDTIEFVYEVI
jgi:hypothetical protein